MTERIVIVGGGTGGTVLTNRLTDELAHEIDAGDVEVTLVNDTPEQTYKPAFLYVAFGKKTMHEARRPLSDLVDLRHANLLIDRVTGIDTENKHLTLANDEGGLDYDHLVLAMGANLDPDEVPGLKEGGHHFYGPNGAEKLRDALAGFTEGHVVLSVIGVPHMCPAAPVEFVLMADAWFRERGIRDQVEITYTYPIMRAHGIQSIADWATELFDERDINLETFFNAEEIDPEANVVKTMEGTELDYDLLVAIPPHTGSELVSDAGLGDDGWVEVDKNTLEATNADDVYAIGDVAALPTSKAGSVAHYAAGTVAGRLASRVRGLVPTETYDGKTICFIESGMDEATFVEFGYGDEPVVREPSQLLHWSKLAYNESYWLTARGLI
ncbi:NAD(P)/FAD-dependent oxidoreductase [Haloferax sp. MBLA0076]|uniref:NAD(P)/FAD-dependent oxidoreductase n=1 Tax=Haloferax litoreum TaxID=2666140 RepID=A0A6A8GBB7_9EURY|nr:MULTISPECIES: FAD/NAD(P)-binding oxidoreductase [Haloferax]KAB1192087.1 NAD(P)/FAD-dependent oxidoreductase [Haloferax sp. CBA1148]MRX20534.1 NAD(P)/FAD-dependent oxidoreductase [Haloferax litoreum]